MKQASFYGLREPKVAGISPFETPDVLLALSLCEAGAVGIVDLGSVTEIAVEALAQLSRVSLSKGAGPLGVRIAEGLSLDGLEIPSQVSLVVIDFTVLQKTPELLNRLGTREIFIQVTSAEEAESALKFGPAGLIAKGSESGGRTGDDAAFILVQEVRKLDIPFWVQGGIGAHTAAACRVAGASGVVLDAQLGLFKECKTSDEIKKALSFADGTETKIQNGRQYFVRPTFSIPSGQDVCLAKGLAQKFGSIKNLVQGFSRSMKGHVKQAKALKPFSPHSPLAQANKTEFAIAQGPMTRVSDRAEFINAVSENGALPFLALSLLKKDQARKILSETQALLGAKPWGVGILGFVPEELQKEQLEVLAEFKPTALLIAGGRPSQAETFEKRGIPTYLHVPSPGLLKQYLKEGARRFVFEGRECGGHVGPRSSFVLWEAQLEVLLGFEAIHEVEVFFAGGIHDALSGAMVAALSAPLAARGAKVGALIGTAYLFTHEAVQTGAIGEQFQREAVRCQKTALLESGPGHATRCAYSPFVEKFTQKKEELKAAKIEAKQIWAELENLNVGRLRVASKGVERIQDRLVEVDQQRQRDEGLFMLGQVAQLRSEACSMRELHEEISVGATTLLEQIEEVTSVPKAPADVAIVGMACIMPGAKDLNDFWKNILGSKTSLTEVPEERWSKDIYFEENSKDPNKSISKWGGFIAESSFDPLEYGIPPNSLGAIEPIQLLSLKVAKQALANAGYSEREFNRERASVIFGAEAGTDLASAYGFRALYPQVAGKLPETLDQSLPTLSEDSFPGVLANVIAGRIANRLDLGGSNYTVDAACASSIAALDLAVKELLHGESDLVLCGGADFHNSINDYLMFSSVHALSPTGKSQPFSAQADGIVLGEGVAVLVLKRLEDAVRDQDRVYAVVKGVGSSSDGKSLGLTAPRKEGQMRALHRAYERAGIDPSQVELVEAHGTGTVVGDRTELETLTEVFSEAGTLNRSCALGSVKSQIGHTKCAAGLAGMIKTSLSIYHGIVPPTLSVVQHPNPSYHEESSPFYFLDQPKPWLSAVRNAGVSAFGFGGTNFHAVLTSYAPPLQNATFKASSAQTAEIFVFKNREQLQDLRLILDRKLDLELSRLAKSVNICNREMGQPPKIAIVAQSFTDLSTKLDLALQGETGKGVFVVDAVDPSKKGKLAFLFSGQGSQSVNMGAELFHTFPKLRKYLEMGSKWSSIIFPNGAGETALSKSEDALKQTEVTQPSLGVIELAMLELTRELKIEADVYGGHSYGELVALCAAGAIAEADLLPLSEARGLAIQQASLGKSGNMAVVFADRETVQTVLDETSVVVANHNAPTQVVISGPEPEIAQCLKAFEARGIRSQRIAVSCAFHSPLVASAEASFAKTLSTLKIGTLAKPVYSNTTGEMHSATGEELGRAMALQIVEPVQFVKQIEKMYQDGARVFLEVGPGSALKGMVSKILGSRPHTALAMDQGGGGLEGLLAVLGELLTHGVSLDPTAFYQDREILAYDLDKLKTQNPSSTTWLINGHLAKPSSGEIPKGALRPAQQPSANLVQFSVPQMGAAEAREQMVREYLKATRQLVESQRQIMLQFLGGNPEAVVQSPIRETVSTRGAQVVSVSSVAVTESIKEAPSAKEVASVVLSVVSQKTGYPAEMLGLDQDLEADLSIDSIKRFEILAEIGERLGLASQAKSGEKGGLEKLASLKTLRALISALESKMASVPVKTERTPEVEVAPSPSLENLKVGQFLITLEEASLPQGGAPLSVSGRRFCIVGEQNGLATELTQALLAVGAQVETQISEDPCDGVIVLGMGNPLEGFKLAQKAIRQGAEWIVGVTSRGGKLGMDKASAETRSDMGVSGLFKSLAKEFSEKVVRVVDVNPSDSMSEVAGFIMAELRSKDSVAEVGYFNKVRRKAVPVPLADDYLETGTKPQPHFNLNSDSVVLMLGGARGIAAKIALQMAQEYQCRFEVVGRSPLPEPESEDTRGYPDLNSLRGFFVKSGKFKKPSEIETECKRILSEREIRSTLERMTSLGSQVQYHSFDVRDKVKLADLIDELYAKGKIDGVIHAAGVLSDSLLLDKSDSAFSRVFETKVNPAQVLSEKLHPDVQFVAFFSSVSGCFGNRGQTDYAAANSWLDQMAQNLSKRLPGRVVSFNWGPWAETGMVTVELENEYRRRGIGLIPPQVGTQRFLSELKFGNPENHQVVVMSGSPESLN